MWSVLSKHKLSRRVTRLLIDSRNELWISPVSCWEIMLLDRKGRLRLPSPAHSWLAEALKTGPFREASLTNEVALAVAEVTLPHSDPADSLLAATARVYGLTLVTSDHELLRGTGFNALENE